MSNLGSSPRNLEEFEAIKRGQLLESLARERKRKLAADRRSKRKKKAGFKKNDPGGD